MLCTTCNYVVLKERVSHQLETVYISVCLFCVECSADFPFEELAVFSWRGFTCVVPPKMSSSCNWAFSITATRGTHAQDTAPRTWPCSSANSAESFQKGSGPWVMFSRTLFCVTPFQSLFSHFVPTKHDLMVSFRDCVAMATPVHQVLTVETQCGHVQLAQNR